MGYIGLENERIFAPKESYCNSYGVHEFVGLDGLKYKAISASSWEGYKTMISNLDTEECLVASPELITCAGDEDSCIEPRVINERIDEVIEISKARPQQTYILGTPLFVNKEKPRNGALIINNGKILDSITKRFGATLEENEQFEMDSEGSPLLLEGTKTAVVICSDLALATLYVCSANEEWLDETLRLSGRKDLIGKRVQIIHPEAETILLVACWSVGGRFVQKGKADDYYRMQLTNISWRLMNETNVKEVIVVDRLPTGLSLEEQSLTPRNPLNGVIRK